MSAPAVPIIDIEEANIPLISASVVPIEPTTIVQVTAPTTLPAGYTFQASYNNEIFIVTVPDGGVIQGQTMYVPFCPTATSMLTQTIATAEATPLILLAPATPINDDTVPLLSNQSETSAVVMDGQWDDHYCDFCDYGCCHPSFCMALFFPRILMAQIMTRLQLNMCANPTTERRASRTCRSMVFLLIAFAFSKTVLLGCVRDVRLRDFDNIDICPPWKRQLDWTLNTMLIVYSMYILIKLRGAVRAKYRIPPARRACFCCCRCCCKRGVCEDICCSVLCSCCTVAQLARQTGNYDTNRASCCTRDGFRGSHRNYRQIRQTATIPVHI